MKIQKDLGDGFRLSFDYFGRSSSPQNHRLTQHFAGRLCDAGLIAEVLEQQVYSPVDGRFLPDRYVVGTCPNCGYPRARGDQCENCTKQLDPTDLIDPARRSPARPTSRSARPSTSPPPEPDARPLRAWIDTKTDWPVLTTSIARKWLDEGLEDRGITRDLDWGIPVARHRALARLEGKVFYVWFDAPDRYIGATAEWADAHGLGDGGWRALVARRTRAPRTSATSSSWARTTSPSTPCASPRRSSAPSRRRALEARRLLKSFNWLNYDGGKFSTARAAACSWTRRSNPARRLLALVADGQRPGGLGSNFTWESSRRAVNKDLADVLGNFVNRVTKFAAARFGETSPTAALRPGGGRLDRRARRRLAAYHAMERSSSARRPRSCAPSGSPATSTCRPPPPGPRSRPTPTGPRPSPASAWT